MQHGRGVAAASRPNNFPAAIGRMRIVHAILSAGFYGSERYCIELALMQARAGHDVIVLAQDEASDCVRAFRAALAEAKSAHAPDLLVMPRALPALLQRPWAWWAQRPSGRH